MSFNLDFIQQVFLYNLKIENANGANVFLEIDSKIRISYFDQ